MIAVAIAAGYGIEKLVAYLRTKRAESNASLEEAEREIIKGINDYDAEHKSNDLIDNKIKEID